MSNSSPITPEISYRIDSQIPDNKTKGRVENHNKNGNKIMVYISKKPWPRSFG